MSKQFMMAAAIGIALAGSASVASADLCRNVDIHIHNSFVTNGASRQIKVVDFDYWDATEGKWREENFVANEIIDYGGNYTISNRDLEYVGGEAGVKIRVQFQYRTTSNGWSDDINATSGTFTCNDEEDVYVTATDIN
jgi:hypothetical protein